jgi:xanthine dehydrogenase YagS FAD-binding subunit
MTMHAFAHANATSIEDVVETLDAVTWPLAGGTDLVALMKDGLVAPERLVNLKTIPGLAGVNAHEDGLHIGALSTLSDLVASPELRERPALAALVQALQETATPQLRHMATIGGNLLQRPRCWYFRNPEVPCWRKGGLRCFAVRAENKYHTLLGASPCYAVHPSDPAVALMALGASVLLVGPGGRRVVPLDEFYAVPKRDRQAADGYHPVALLATDEVVAEIIIPDAPEGTWSAYVKVMDRGAWDFALVSAAVCLTMAGDLVEAARVALGGVATIPWRAEAAETALVGRSLTSDTSQAAAEAAISAARPLEHNGYKVELVKNVVAQALKAR